MEKDRFTKLIEADPEGWSKRLNPRMTKYFLHSPTEKQAAFLLLSEIEEAFYGGAGGGGKSDALLMAALQYSDVPGYSALILRRSFTDLSLPGALIDRSHEWFDGTGARWNEQLHTWTFPCDDGGHSTLAFGYLKDKRAHHRYRSAEFQYIAFDELTEFEDENQFLFLRSRLRRRAGVKIPLRLRSASNPGGPGHEWVKRRYIKRGAPASVFIRALLYDNPHIDQAAYERQLLHLPPILRAQILEGNWDVSDGGKVINRIWFRDFLNAVPSTPLRVRAWDLAASSDGKRTAGVRMSRVRRGNQKCEYWVEHVAKGHWTPGERDERIVQIAQMDAAELGGPEKCHIIIEQEPGSGGVMQNYELAKKLKGFPVESILVTGTRSRVVTYLSAKIVRLGPFASAAEQGNVGIVGAVSNDWVDEFLDELHNIPDGKYIDQGDGASLGYNWLSEKESWQIMPELPKDKACECGMRPHEPWCDDGMDDRRTETQREGWLRELRGE